MVPQRLDLVLAAHVPYGEVDVFTVHGLHFESDSGDVGHDLTQLQYVQDGGLSHSIQAHQEKMNFFFCPKKGLC